MPILSDDVQRYLEGLRPERSPVMAEMEELAARDSVPIVHWETGRFLAAICGAMDPIVLEVGTAIGPGPVRMLRNAGSLFRYASITAGTSQPVTRGSRR